MTIPDWPDVYSGPQQFNYLPAQTAALARRIAEDRENRLMVYLRAYNEAAGEFLEYVYQRPANPLDGARLWENS